MSLESSSSWLAEHAHGRPLRLHPSPLSIIATSEIGLSLTFEYTHIRSTSLVCGNLGEEAESLEDIRKSNYFRGWLTFSMKNQTELVLLLGLVRHAMLQLLSFSIAAQERLQTVCKQVVWLCSNKTLFTKTGGSCIWCLGPGVLLLASPMPQN